MIAIKLNKCNSCHLIRYCSKFDSAIRIFFRNIKSKYGYNAEIISDLEKILISLKKYSCWLCKNAVTNTKRNDNIDKTDFNEILNYYCDKFKIKYNGEKPFITAIDGNTVKILMKQFSKEKIKFLIERYLNMDNNFLVSVGYGLKHIMTNVNSILVSEIKNNSTLEWVRYVSNEQLFEFLRLKQLNQWDPGIDGESLTKAYQNEIVSRKLTRKNFIDYLIKICDYTTIQLIDKKLRSNEQS